MKSNKPIIIAGAAIVVAAAVAITIIAVNSNNNGANGGQTTSSTTSENSVLWSQDGIEIKKATIEQVGEGSFNIVTVLANNTSEEVEFDNSQFRYELADGYVIKPASTTKTLEANRPYIQSAQSLSKEENSHLKLGDKVTVYYGDTKLATNTIEEF